MFDLLGVKPFLCKNSVYKPCNESAPCDIIVLSVILINGILIYKGYVD